MSSTINFSKNVLIFFFFFFFFFFVLSFLTITIEASPEYVYHNCNSTTFSPNSTYEANLNNLLSSLASRSEITGFSNLTAGRNNSSVVYGNFLCRGDVAADVCHDCVTAASEEILRQCPGQEIAIIWYEECMLRYTNEYIFSIAQDHPGVYSWSEENVTEPERFMRLLGETVNDIVTRVVSDQSGKRFATEEANFSGMVKIYSLAQCTPDLSEFGCEACLRNVIGDLPACCDGRKEGSVLAPSCMVMYGVSPFYRIIATPQLPNPVAPESDHLPSRSEIHPTTGKSPPLPLLRSFCIVWLQGIDYSRFEIQAELE